MKEDVRCLNDVSSIPVKKWLSDELWREVKKKLPIATLDIIFERDGKTLFGYRRIEPYKDVWAFPGGRFLFGEGIREAAERIAFQYKLRPKTIYLVGVFPIAFRTRSDVAIAIASPTFEGDAEVDGIEFSSFAWFSEVPKKVGANYRRMLSKWQEIKKETRVLSLNLI